MKTKLIIGLMLLIACGFLFFIRGKKHGIEYWSIRASSAMNKVALLRLTNSWRTVEASGREFRFFDKKTSQYFILQEGTSKAFQELQGELERQQQIQTSSATRNRSGFLYVPEGYGAISKDDQALRHANWWHPESQGSGIIATLSTNYNHMCIVVDIYAFNHATNALLFGHVFVRN